MSILNKHAPIKFKYIRANDSPFMNTELRKAMMLRSKLRNSYHKNKALHAHLAYKRQRTIVLLSLENQRKNSMGVLIPPLFQTIRNFGKLPNPFSLIK